MAERPRIPDEEPKTKADKRKEMRRKEQLSPTGGSWAAQAKRAQVNKNYEGLPKALKPKVSIQFKKGKK